MGASQPRLLAVVGALVSIGGWQAVLGLGAPAGVPGSAFKLFGVLIVSAALVVTLWPAISGFSPWPIGRGADIVLAGLVAGAAVTIAITSRFQLELAIPALAIQILLSAFVVRKARDAPALASQTRSRKPLGLRVLPLTFFAVVLLTLTHIRLFDGACAWGCVKGGAAGMPRNSGGPGGWWRV